MQANLRFIEAVKVRIRRRGTSDELEMATWPKMEGSNAPELGVDSIPENSSRECCFLRKF